MENELWDSFEKSGKRSDYLRYKGYPGSDCDAADNSQWRSDKRTSVG